MHNPFQAIKKIEVERFTALPAKFRKKQVSPNGITINTNNTQVLRRRQARAADLAPAAEARMT